MQVNRITLMAIYYLWWIFIIPVYGDVYF